MLSSNRVRWQDIDSETYEQMVAVLISRLHPNAQRIDGSGGDGGRDVQIPSEAGLEIFQLKSHTGRMSSSQRSQVKNSLRRAAEHNPSSWHLVVPIDPTPGEMKWFEALTGDYTFPCSWHGLTWLDRHIAQMPEIARYYLEDGRDEIIGLLREFNLERTALSSGGVSDALERMNAIQDRLDTLDPHYTFHFASHPDGSRDLAVVSRYPEAWSDSPMYLYFEFSFPDTPEARSTLRALQDTINYGSSCTIPPEYVSKLDMPAGLGGEQTVGELALSGAGLEEVPDARIQLQVRNEHEIPVMQLPLKLVKCPRGRRGGILTFSDSSEAVTAELRFDAEDRQAGFSYQFSEPENYSPAALLPAVEFIAEAGRAASVAILENGRIFAVGEPASAANTEGAADFVNLLKDLVFLQTRSGVYFDLHGHLTPEEVYELDEAVRLLRGEVLTGTWNSMTIDVKPERYTEVRTLALSNPNHRIQLINSKSIIIQGVSIPIGEVICQFESAAVNQDTPPSPDSLPTATMTFIPGETDTVTRYLKTGREHNHHSPTKSAQ